MSESMEDLKYVVERSEAETPQELIEYANSLYIGNPEHDAFVHGAGSADELVEKKIEEMRTEWREYKDEQEQKLSENLSQPMRKNIESNIAEANGAFTALTELLEFLKQKGGER